MAEDIDVSDVPIPVLYPYDIALDCPEPTDDPDFCEYPDDDISYSDDIVVEEILPDSPDDDTDDDEVS